MKARNKITKMLEEMRIMTYLFQNQAASVKLNNENVKSIKILKEIEQG